MKLNIEIKCNIWIWTFLILCVLKIVGCISVGWAVVLIPIYVVLLGVLSKVLSAVFYHE